ncbi:S41 family peptidase [Flavobacterium sp. DGU11]|uniref:S41 family peptidase n=1 Tax=Flavobacterium arundinis TaxID=3139143 RepID=A0ABU9HR63_9FLAO
MPDKKHTSPEVTAYIEEVVAILEKNSVNRKKIDWTELRQKVRQKAGDAKTIADTYPSIHYALKLLGDSHSYFAPITDQSEDTKGAPPVLHDEKVPGTIGYVRVRYCMGNAKQKQQYIDNLLNDIRIRDKQGLIGWIIDLRGNFGGDMSPMLAGIGPVLGNGIIGYTQYPDGKESTWRYDKGKFLFDGDSDTILEEEYILKNKDPYVAVLKDTLTASSGEAVTVAFRGRPKTKSFGTHTYGVPTSNQRFDLSDGSNILLTVAVFADRNHKPYQGPIHPDTETTAGKALSEAVNWLKQQNRH